MGRTSCDSRFKSKQLVRLTVALVLGVIASSCADIDSAGVAVDVSQYHVCSEGAERTITVGLLGFEGNPNEAEPKQLAVELAIEDVNAAGGFFGTTIELKQALVPNDGSFVSVQLEDVLDAAEQLADTDVVVTLIGSRHSIEVLRNDSIQVPQISGSQTSSALIEVGEGRYFRTVPSDAIQGSLIAEEVAAFGYQSVAIVYVDDTYGQSLAQAFIGRTLQRSRSAPIEHVFGAAGELEVAMADLVAQEPDAIVFFGYSKEASSLIAGLANRGLSGVDYWLSDGGAGVGEELKGIGADPGLLTGARLVVPSPDLNRGAVDAFRARLESRLGYTSGFALAPESYDAGVVAALAVAATCANPEQLTNAIVDVSLGSSDEAIECTVGTTQPASPETGPGDSQASEDGAPENCLELLWRSQLDVDLDYNGISGSVDLSNGGEPGRGGYLIRTYGGDGFDPSLSRYVLEAAQPIARTALLPRIEFANGSAQIPESALPNLNQAAAVISQPEVGVISVEGYASLDGDPEANRILADARAQAVVTALVERGVPASKLIPVGRSATDRFPENRVVVFVDGEGDG